MTDEELQRRIDEHKMRYSPMSALKATGIVVGAYVLFNFIAAAMTYAS